MSKGNLVNPNFSAPARLVEKIDNDFIEFVRKETGVKLTRSALIQIFFELTLEHKDGLDTEKIFDKASLKEELKNAIKKS